MEPETKITFGDVAGIEGAKLELTEVVDFLKNPDRFTAVGAKIPLVTLAMELLYLLDILLLKHRVSEQEERQLQFLLDLNMPVPYLMMEQ